MYRDTKVPEEKKCLAQDIDVNVLTTQAIESSQSVTKKQKSYRFETYQPTSLKSAEEVGDATGNIFSDLFSRLCNTSGATSETLSDTNVANVTSLAIVQELGAQHQSEPQQSSIEIKSKNPLPQSELDNSTSSAQKENIELKFGVVQYTGQSKPVFGVPQNKNWRENSSRNWRKILNRNKNTIQPKYTEVDNNTCPWSNNHLRRVVVETKSVPTTSSNQRDNSDTICIINFVAVKVKGKEVAPGGQRLPTKRTPIASCIKAKSSITSSPVSGASLLGENTLKCEAFEHDVYNSYEDTTLEMKIDQCDSEVEAATTDSAFSELTVTAPTSASNTPDLFQLDDEADPIKSTTPPNEPLLLDSPAKDSPSLVSQNRSTYASKFSASKPNFITEKFLLASLYKTTFDAAKEEESAEERQKCGATDLRLAKARNTISTALSKQQLRDQYYRNNVTTTVPR